MTERHDDLVAALAALGDHVGGADPAAPDPVTAAVRRIAAAPGRPVRLGPRRRPLVLAAAALVVAVAVVVAVPSSRAALARLLGIGAVRVVITDDVPADLAGPYDLGDPITLREAIERAPGPVVPGGLGPPAAAFAGEPAGAVTVVWHSSSELPPIDPAAGVDAGLVVTAIPGPVGDPVLVKEVGPATEMVATTVAGNPGYWISGGPHTVRVVGGPGGVVPDVVRLAGNTLLWTDGDLTYRLESALDHDGAVALAERVPAHGP